MIKRCDWCLGEEIYMKYHDTEWGVPSYDDMRLFEFFLLEGAQAGLSWITILKKREGYRKAFDGFDPFKIAHYDDLKIEELMHNSEVIRNRLKIKAFINNSRIYVEKFSKPGSFSSFLWSFTNGRPIINKFEKMSDLPAVSKEAEEMSSALKKLGFKFIGPVSCYAFMQSVGMVNDHIGSCFRYNEVNGMAYEK